MNKLRVTSKKNLRVYKKIIYLLQLNAATDHEVGISKFFKWFYVFKY